MSKYDALVRSVRSGLSRAYVCSPYRGDTAVNVLNAKIYCQYTLLKKRFHPVCPHLFYPHFLNDGDEQERELGLQLAKRDILPCKRMFVFLGADRFISEGMQAEIEYAQRNNVTVEFITYEQIKEFIEENKSAGLEAES